MIIKWPACLSIKNSVVGQFGFVTPGFRACVKTRVWHWPGWTPASAGVTELDLARISILNSTCESLDVGRHQY